MRDLKFKDINRNNFGLVLNGSLKDANALIDFIAKKTELKVIYQTQNTEKLYITTKSPEERLGDDGYIEEEE